MSKHTDVYHVDVTDINPHEIVEVIQDEETPFDPDSASVHAHKMDENGQIIGGTVEVWVHEHPTPAQEEFFYDACHGTMKHVWP